MKIGGSWNQKMQKNYLTDILSSIEMAAEKLRDIDPDSKRSSTVKRSIRDVLYHYYEILEEKMTKIKTIDVTFFLDVF